jgi:hypothetical protein
MVAPKDVEKQLCAVPANAPADALEESPGEGHVKGNRPSSFSSTTQEILFVLTVTMAVAMSSFLMGTMTVILTSIGKDLNMSTAEISWINASSSYVRLDLTACSTNICLPVSRPAPFCFSLAE